MKLIFDTTEENRQVRHFVQLMERHTKRRECSKERATDLVQALRRENWLPELRRCLAQLSTGTGTRKKVAKDAFFFLGEIESEILRAEFGDEVDLSDLEAVG